MKENIPVVVGERQNESDRVFINHAAKLNCQLKFASDHYNCEFISDTETGQKFEIRKASIVLYPELETDLKGIYQRKNICTVLQSLEFLSEVFQNIKSEHILNGLKNVSKNTGLAGRWQILAKQPLTIADVAHNEEGIRLAMEQLVSLKHDRLHIVFGMVNDKNISSILSLLPKHATYYFTKAGIARALDADILTKEALGVSLHGKAFSSVSEAYEAALKSAGKNDLIFIGGSNFIVSEIV
jgi:dihydrofolate synthase/folylpolyglutamate synthase